MAVGQDVLRRWLQGLGPDGSDTPRDFALASVIEALRDDDPVVLSLACRILRNICAPPYSRQADCAALAASAALADAIPSFGAVSEHARLYAAQFASNFVAGRIENAVAAARDLYGAVRAWIDDDQPLEVRAAGLSFVFNAMHAGGREAAQLLVPHVANTVVDILDRHDPRTMPDCSFWSTAIWTKALKELAMAGQWAVSLELSATASFARLVTETVEPTATENELLWPGSPDDDHALASAILAFCRDQLSKELQSSPESTSTQSSLRAVATCAGTVLFHLPAHCSPMPDPILPDLATAAADHLAQLISHDAAPEPGTRASLLRLVAVTVHGSAAAQNAVVNSAGGVGSVLGAMGAIDPTEPTAREWGVFAIRNLTENNPEVQREIARYELRSARASPELAEAGLEAYMDSDDGRPKLRQRPVPSDSPP